MLHQKSKIAGLAEGFFFFFFFFFATWTQPLYSASGDRCLQGNLSALTFPFFKPSVYRNGLPLVYARLVLHLKLGVIVRPFAVALSYLLPLIDFVAAGRPLDLAAAEKPVSLGKPGNSVQDGGSMGNWEGWVLSRGNPCCGLVFPMTANRTSSSAATVSGFSLGPGSRAVAGGWRFQGFRPTISGLERRPTKFSWSAGVGIWMS